MTSWQQGLYATVHSSPAVYSLNGCRSSLVDRKDEKVCPSSFRRVEIDDGADGVLADRAEALAAVEHDALHLGPVVAAGLVICPFEGAHQVPHGRPGEQGLGMLQVFAEQGAHLGLGPVGGPQRRAAG